MNGSLREDLSTQNITFTNVEEGLDFMEYVSWNVYKELNAWAYQDIKGREKLDVAAYGKNSWQKSYQPPYPKNGIFNIHTHPGNREGTNGGKGKPSKRDWEGYNERPLKRYYILSRKQGLTIYGNVNGKIDYFTPGIKETPKVLQKYIVN